MHKQTQGIEKAKLHQRPAVHNCSLLRAHTWAVSVRSACVRGDCTAAATATAMIAWPAMPHVLTPKITGGMRPPIKIPIYLPQLRPYSGSAEGQTTADASAPPTAPC
eukprot:2069374-Pleurochrysis_carterae.AAC.1